MCRNIKVLYNFEPPTTPEEIRAAATQYVRKVSGLSKPSSADQDVFEKAINDITSATEILLANLVAKTQTRSRELEKERAKKRFAARNKTPLEFGYEAGKIGPNTDSISIHFRLGVLSTILNLAPQS